METPYLVHPKIQKCVGDPKRWLGSDWLSANSESLREQLQRPAAAHVVVLDEHGHVPARQRQDQHAQKHGEDAEAHNVLGVSRKEDLHTKEKDGKVSGRVSGCFGWKGGLGGLFLGALWTTRHVLEMCTGSCNLLKGPPPHLSSHCLIVQRLFRGTRTPCPHYKTRTRLS